MYRKFFCVILCVFCFFGGIFEEVSFADFADVGLKDPNFGSITALEEEGILVGKGDGLFHPYDNLNRAEFVKIVVEALGVGIEVGPEVVGRFPDVVVEEWYGPYVYKALELDWIDGRDDGNFWPGEPVNFVEASKILAEAFDLDLDDGGEEWFDPFVTSLNEMRIIPASIYGLGQNLSRAEMAEMIWRLKYVNDFEAFKNVDYADLDRVSEGRISVDLVNSFPDEVDLIFGIDYTNPEQVQGFKDFWDNYGRGFSNFEDEVTEKYEKGVKGFADSFSYRLMMKPIIDSGFEAYMALKVPEWVGELDQFKGLSLEEGEFDSYVVGRFAEYGKARLLLDALLDRLDGLRMGHEIVDGIEYWTNAREGFYFALMGDVFVLANSSEGRDELLKNLRHGSGFDWNRFKYANYFEDGLFANFYARARLAGWVYKEYFDEYGKGIYFNYGKDTYFNMFFENGDLKMREYYFDRQDEGLITEEIPDDEGILIKQILQ